MWDWRTPENLISMQRQAALGYMGEQARILLREGYPAEADRMLDALNERRVTWERDPQH